VFHPALAQSHRKGGIFLDALGFKRVTHSTGWSAEVVLLMQDGHVVYKLMSDRPHIESTDNSV